MKHIFSSTCVCLGLLLAAATGPAHAQVASRVLGDVAPKEAYQERIPVREDKVPAAVETRKGEACGMNARLSPGVTVWFFDEEDTEVGPAGFLDVWHCELPLNFRVGIEGTHMDLEQDSAQAFAERSDKDARISFFRIPFAIEYILPVAERTQLFLGGGPDIIHTANDNSDTNVGMHLAARIGYNFTEHVGIAIEGGYMWGEVDGSGGDVVLDNAYITPLFTYTF